MPDTPSPYTLGRFTWLSGDVSPREDMTAEQEAEWVRGLFDQMLCKPWTGRRDER